MPTGKEQQEQLNDRLLLAVEEKDAQAVAALLGQGADANTRWKNEPSLLNLAVKGGDKEIVTLIAAATQYLDLSDDCDFTAFTHAVRHNKADVAHALLDAGAKPFPGGDGQEYPLDWAVGNKMYGVIGHMLKSWPDRHYKDEPLLIYAAKMVDMELAQACIAAGANVNRGTPKNGFTALHVAARGGSKELINFLLDAGASLEIKANGHQTPFDWTNDGGAQLGMIIAERNMRAAAQEMTEGLPDRIVVLPPYRLKRNRFSL